MAIKLAHQQAKSPTDGKDVSTRDYADAAGGPADDLSTTGADINVSAAAPPSSGQVLTATGATAATWQTPAPSADVAVKVTGADTTAGNLNAKIAAGANISLAVLNPGVNEQLEITSTGGTDADAVHDNVAGEIAAIAAKSPVVAADKLLIEDSADANAKKSITVADLRITESQITDLAHTAAGGAGTDTTAIHDNVAGEINAVALKATPIAADVILIEDSADSFNKKKATLTDLLGGGVANPIILETGNGTASAPAGFASAVLSHTYQNGGGAASVSVGATRPGLAVGAANAGYAASVADILQDSHGGFAMGSSSARYGTSLIKTEGPGGAFAGGYARDIGSGDSIIHAYGRGAMAFGYSKTGYGSTAYQEVKIYARGSGAFARGAATGGGGSAGDARIYAPGQGSFAGGLAYAPYSTPGLSDIRSDGNGSFAHGSANGGGAIRAYQNGSFATGEARNAGVIEAYGYGAFACGYAFVGKVRASGYGSFAGGRSYNYNIYASNLGAFAFGNADGFDITASGIGNMAVGSSNGGAITASGSSNCFQFGQGVNALADSFQVGSAGLRFRLLSSFSTPQDGDIGVDGSGNIQMRSNGATTKVAGLDVSQKFTGNQYPEITTLTDGANVAIVASANNIQELTCGALASRQLDNATGVVKGMSWQVWFHQDGVGGRGMTFGTNYDWGDEGAPVFTGQGANISNVITFVALSPTQIFGTVLKGAA